MPNYLLIARIVRAGYYFVATLIGIALGWLAVLHGREEEE